jgi:hypothetical protein
MERICDRSIKSPPSQTALPTMLWPPPRTTTSAVSVCEHDGIIQQRRLFQSSVQASVSRNAVTTGYADLTGVQPRLGPPLVDRDLAIVYPLLVHPFSA